jgi:hypothetical protein
MIQFDPQYGKNVPGGYTGPAPSDTDKYLDNPFCNEQVFPDVSKLPNGIRPLDCSQQSGSK